MLLSPLLALYTLTSWGVWPGGVALLGYRPPSTLSVRNISMLSSDGSNCVHPVGNNNGIKGRVKKKVGIHDVCEIKTPRKNHLIDFYCTLQFDTFYCNKY